MALSPTIPTPPPSPPLGPSSRRPHCPSHLLLVATCSSTPTSKWSSLLEKESGVATRLCQPSTWVCQFSKPTCGGWPPVLDLGSLHLHLPEELGRHSCLRPKSRTNTRRSSALPPQYHYETPTATLWGHQERSMRKSQGKHVQFNLGSCENRMSNLPKIHVKTIGKSC